MKKKRERTTRREAARAVSKLGEAREKLFLREPGGSSEHPVAVDSAAVVEVRARGTACPRCGGEHVVDEHAAVNVGGELLREARLRCRACGSRRSLWFRLPVLN